MKKLLFSIELFPANPNALLFLTIIISAFSITVALYLGYSRVPDFTPLWDVSWGCTHLVALFAAEKNRKRISE